MGLREAWTTLVHEYVFDTNELGKFIIVVSATLLLVSSHTVLTLNDSIQRLEDVNQEYDRLSSFVNTQSFNRTVEAIGSIQSSNLDLRGLAETAPLFRQLQQHVGESRDVVRMLETRHEQYQWLVLVSILGLIAGVLTLYL